MADIGLDNFFTALWTNSSGNIFDYDQISFDPKVLFDLPLDHQFAANMTLAVIVTNLIHIPSFALLREWPE